MALHELELAPGWRAVEPRANAPELLIEEDGHLRHVRSDFSEISCLGQVGPVDCPIAYDRQSRTAYRYVCESRLRCRDFSQLVAYDLHAGESRKVLELPLNQWILWLLEWIEGNDKNNGQLFGLLASDLPVEEGVVIRHQLFAMDVHEPRLRPRPVCRDAYSPLAFSRRRKELLFSGAEGIYLTGLNGERRACLDGQYRPAGRGGCFDPSGRGRAALGGEGLYLWDFEVGNCRQLARRGQYPLWATDGKGIWYSESSSDLLYYDLESGRSGKLIDVRGDRNPERSFARAARQSPDGRFLAIPLTVKRLKGVAAGKMDPTKRERVYQFEHAFCILDLARRELWRMDGFISSFCWIDSTRCDY